MKEKRTLIYLIMISIFLISMMALLISAESNTKTGAKAFALYCPQTNTFLAGNNIDIKLPMASTTKIITALVAIERLNLDEYITVSKEAVGIEGSSIYLQEGDILTVKDLVYSVLLQSANDASVVLALKIGGSVEAFAEIMNERAREIGAFSTHFDNPHGLDSATHYTTAKDLSLIASEALKNEIFKSISSTHKYSFSIGDKTRTLVNHNKLLRNYDGCIGVKTGYTKKCGRCLVSAAEKNGVRLIAVTLDDPNDWSDHTALLDSGFQKVKSVDLLSLVSIPDSLPVISGNKDFIKIAISNNDRYLITNDDVQNIKTDIKLIPYITQATNAGDAVGSLIVKTENNTKKIDILAMEDVSIKRNKTPFIA